MAILGHVEELQKERNVYRTFSGDPEGKRTLQKFKPR